MWLNQNKIFQRGDEVNGGVLLGDEERCIWYTDLKMSIFRLFSNLDYTIKEL